MIMLSADYIVGLTDGEGSFTAYIREPRSEHGAKNYRIECHYYIKLRDDNLTLLKKVKQFFGIGRLSFQRDLRPNHHSCYRYEVTSLEDMSDVIIPFFRKHRLQGDKIKDFILLQKIVRMTLKKKHHTAIGLAQIRHWKSQMHQYADSPNTGKPFVRPGHGKFGFSDMMSENGNGK